MQTPSAEIAVARDFQKLRSIFTHSMLARGPTHSRPCPSLFFSLFFTLPLDLTRSVGRELRLPPTKASGAMAGTASSDGGHRERRRRSGRRGAARRRASRAAAAEQMEGSTAAAGTSASLRRPRICGGSDSRPRIRGPRHRGRGGEAVRRAAAPRQFFFFCKKFFTNFFEFL